MVCFLLMKCGKRLAPDALYTSAMGAALVDSATGTQCWTPKWQHSRQCFLHFHTAVFSRTINGMKTALCCECIVYAILVDKAQGPCLLSVVSVLFISFLWTRPRVPLCECIVYFIPVDKAQGPSL